MSTSWNGPEHVCATWAERDHMYLGALLQALKIKLFSLLASGYKQRKGGSSPCPLEPGGIAWRRSSG